MISISKSLSLVAALATLLAGCSEDIANFDQPPSGYVNAVGELCDLTPGLEPPPGYALDTLGSLAGLDTAAPSITGASGSPPRSAATSSRSGSPAASD